MLTAQQFEQVENWIDVDPVQVALKTGDAILAQWIAGLQKAKTKVPSFFEHRCELTTVMVEQATSELVARSRVFKGGQLAIDLTCGMGVDSWALSRAFERVVAVEIDRERAEITRQNFKSLGVYNVEVICSSAEDFMSRFNGKADLVFCDPSRRTVGGKRLYGLSDCAPDIIKLMPELKSKTGRIMVKLSPIFDVDELFRLFGSCDVEVVSLNNECKEVVLHLSEDCNSKIINTVVKHNEVERFEFHREKGCVLNIVDDVKFVAQPDVSFYKSRTVEQYIKSNYKNVMCEGYVFSAYELDGFCGRQWRVDKMLIYQPKKLKTLLKESGITRATILQKNFICDNITICKQLGIKEGGVVELLFSSFKGEPYCFFLSQSNPAL